MMDIEFKLIHVSQCKLRSQGIRECLSLSLFLIATTILTECLILLRISIIFLTEPLDVPGIKFKSII